MTEDWYLYEAAAFWALVGAQQLVTGGALWRVVATLRRESSVMLLFFSLVLVYSVVRTLYFLVVAVNYPLEVFEMLDVTSVSLFVGAMSVLCWLWWDIFLQFSGVQGRHRQNKSTRFYLSVNGAMVLWNYACIVILFWVGFPGVVIHYLNHINAAVECLCLGLSLYRAAQHAKWIVHALLKAPTCRISLVQAAGVSCCLLRVAIYTLSVVLQSQHESSKRSQSWWKWCVSVLLLYAGADLLPLCVLLWVVRVRQRASSSETSSLLSRSQA